MFLSHRIRAKRKTTTFLDLGSKWIRSNTKSTNYVHVSSWIIFRNDIHNQLKSIPSWSGDIKRSRYASERWKAVPPEVKQTYIDLANQEKEAHQRAHPNYRYKPRRGATSRGSPSEVQEHQDISSISSSGSPYENSMLNPVPSSAHDNLTAAIAERYSKEHHSYHDEYKQNHNFYSTTTSFNLTTPPSVDPYNRINYCQDNSDRPFRSFDGICTPNFEYHGDGLLIDTRYYTDLPGSSSRPYWLAQSSIPTR